jgi:hypothetical protein
VIAAAAHSIAFAFLLAAALLNMATANAGNRLVVVNPAGGIDQLTRSQVIDIVLGRYRKLPSGAIAIPIDLRVDTAERKEFYLILVGKDLQQMSFYWARLVFSGQAAPPFRFLTHAPRPISSPPILTRSHTWSVRPSTSG